MVAPSDSGVSEKHFLPPQYERENKMGTFAEIQNPKPGDSITSACGTIKVTVKDDGSLPVSVLSKRRGRSIFSCTTRGKQNQTRLFFEPMIPECLHIAWTRAEG
jgi:hypothetical protein